MSEPGYGTRHPRTSAAAAHRKLFGCHWRGAIFAHVDGPLRPLHDPAHHWHKRFQRHGVVIWIECVLVVARAKCRRVLECRMTAELFAHVSIEPEIVKEIITLENAVVG